MKGTAKLFVEYESQATNWNDLGREIIDEFGQKINSAVIHQKLQDRKIKRDETSIEYLYAMLAIASHSEIDVPAIITYTIKGLPGPSHLKTFM